MHDICATSAAQEHLDDRLTCRSPRSACAAGMGVCCLRSPLTLCRLLWCPTGPCCMASYTFWSTLTALKATYLQLMARSSSCGQHQSHQHMQEDLRPCTPPTLFVANTFGMPTLCFIGEFSAAQHSFQHRPHEHHAPHPCRLGALLHRYHWCCTPPECRASPPALLAACWIGNWEA